MSCEYVRPCLEDDASFAELHYLRFAPSNLERTDSTNQSDNDRSAPFPGGAHQRPEGKGEAPPNVQEQRGDGTIHDRSALLAGGAPRSPKGKEGETSDIHDIQECGDSNNDNKAAEPVEGHAPHTEKRDIGCTGKSECGNRGRQQQDNGCRRHFKSTECGSPQRGDVRWHRSVPFRRRSICAGLASHPVRRWRAHDNDPLELSSTSSGSQRIVELHLDRVASLSCQRWGDKATAVIRRRHTDDDEESSLRRKRLFQLDNLDVDQSTDDDDGAASFKFLNERPQSLLGARSSSMKRIGARSRLSMRGSGAGARRCHRASASSRSRRASSASTEYRRSRSISTHSSDRPRHRRSRSDFFGSFDSESLLGRRETIWTEHATLDGVKFFYNAKYDQSVWAPPLGKRVQRVLPPTGPTPPDEDQPESLLDDTERIAAADMWRTGAHRPFMHVQDQRFDNAQRRARRLGWRLEMSRPQRFDSEGVWSEADSIDEPCFNIVHNDVWKAPPSLLRRAKDFVFDKTHRRLKKRLAAAGACGACSGLIGSSGEIDPYTGIKYCHSCAKMLNPSPRGLPRLHVAFAEERAAAKQGKGRVPKAATEHPSISSEGPKPPTSRHSLDAKSIHGHLSRRMFAFEQTRKFVI